MDETERLVRTIILGVIFVLTIMLGSCHLSNLHTLQMAQAGFCYQTIIVPAQAGVNGTTYSQWAPCRVQDAAPGAAAK